MNTVVWKDYALRDDDAVEATALTRDEFEEKVARSWYVCPIDRKALKGLIRRSDRPALGYFALWLALLAASGAVAFTSWGTWWAVPAFFTYGTLYSVAEQRHHELSHGTPFRTRWINEALYHLCAFMALHEGVYYRWSHTRHHTHTLIVGKDPEIPTPRPPDVLRQFLDFFFIRGGMTELGRIFRNAGGTLVEAGRHFVPVSERRKVVWSSRAYVAVLAVVALACVGTERILPVVFVVGPRFYGGVFPQLINLTLHAGMREDVHDHRLNTRTVLMNPAFRFLYANMNYHIEHHMFPMVPFHRLPELHAMIRSDCPPAYPGIWAAWKEIVPMLIRQTRDPSLCVNRPLPATEVSVL
jgi:fatty acid desaturase